MGYLVIIISQTQASAQASRKQGLQEFGWPLVLSLSGHGDGNHVQEQSDADHGSCVTEEHNWKNMKEMIWDVV